MIFFQVVEKSHFDSFRGKSALKWPYKIHLFWILSCRQIWSETKHLGLYASRPYQGCFFSAQIFEKKKSIGFEKITFTNNINIYSMKTDREKYLRYFGMFYFLRHFGVFLEHRFSMLIIAFLILWSIAFQNTADWFEKI